MPEKKLTARIRQKTDTKANWDKATNFVPLKGEVIIYSDLNKMKVGDGATRVGNLPFITNVSHGLMADSQRTPGSFVYYKLASFPADNEGNMCSLTLDGRIGGWNKGSKGYISMIIGNRDGVDATGTLLGNADLSLCDLVVYTSGTTSANSTAILYAKTYSWFAFDFTLGAAGGAVDIWDGQGMRTTPAGTLVWSLSGNVGKFLRVRDNGDLEATAVYTNKLQFAASNYITNIASGSFDISMSSGMIGTQASYDLTIPNYSTGDGTWHVFPVVTGDSCNSLFVGVGGEVSDTGGCTIRVRNGRSLSSRTITIHWLAVKY